MASHGLPHTASARIVPHIVLICTTFLSISSVVKRVLLYKINSQAYTVELIQKGLTLFAQSRRRADGERSQRRRNCHFIHRSHFLSFGVIFLVRLN